VPGARERVGERHREAGRFGGGDQLLRARDCVGAFGACLPGDPWPDTAPLAASTVPLPSSRFPCHMACPRRSAIRPSPRLCARRA
jgi:hypothetical protein